MEHLDPAGVSEADWLAQQRRSMKRLRWAALIGAVCVPILTVVAMLLTDSFITGSWRYVAVAITILVLFVPVAGTKLWLLSNDQIRGSRIVATLTHQLSDALGTARQQAARRELQADRQEFEARLANALDMAEGEPEVVEVVERSFATILPGAAAELLLADNSHAHLTRMAQSAVGSPGCGVTSPDQCPAARRAQVQRFETSDALDACPKLRGREEGAVSAVCVPVSIMGRTVGVIHSTSPAGVCLSDDTVQDLGTLSKLGGARIGLLRVMAETQLQASTDSLTGLLNRRSFETQVAIARRETPLVSVAMADLDHFKTLNDTYGHDTGDRALRLFAQVLAGSVRSQDLICRQGGEEFVVALMACEGEIARDVLDAVRTRLKAAITVAGLPAFTVSFGLVESRGQEGLPTLIDRADAALFEAKRTGRDRVVRHDAIGSTVVSPAEVGRSHNDPRGDDLDHPIPSRERHVV